MGDDDGSDASDDTDTHPFSSRTTMSDGVVLQGGEPGTLRESPMRVSLRTLSRYRDMPFRSGPLLLDPACTNSVCVAQTKKSQHTPTKQPHNKVTPALQENQDLIQVRVQVRMLPSSAFFASLNPTKVFPSGLSSNYMKLNLPTR